LPFGRFSTVTAISLRVPIGNDYHLSCAQVGMSMTWEGSLLRTRNGFSTVADVAKVTG
jgi:hypothetical protein